MEHPSSGSGEILDSEQGLGSNYLHRPPWQVRPHNADGELGIRLLDNLRPSLLMQAPYIPHPRNRFQRNHSCPVTFLSKKYFLKPIIRLKITEAEG